MTERLEYFQGKVNEGLNQVSRVIVGQEEAIRMSLIIIFTGQHGLLEGVPGVAKTLLVNTLSRVLGCDFGRIQFTPDLMPSDITGTNVFEMNTGQFKLVKGPVFTTFLLADEINRAPAKTQAALLQAMQERQVSIDNTTHSLSPDFTVFATQNPIEFEGTYPLPEAQKDRFMMKVVMDFPSAEEETELAARFLTPEPPQKILSVQQFDPVIQPGDLDRLKSCLDDVQIREELISYIVGIVRATREAESVLVGAGPRATQSLLLASRAQAAMESRDFVTPDDVRSMAQAVLGHRVVLRPEFEIEGMAISEVVNQILNKVPVPR